MKELTWLGSCREQELDILITIGLKSADYFEPPAQRVENEEEIEFITGYYKEENRLRNNITARYDILAQKVDPKNYLFYPQEMQTIAGSLHEELQHTYDLLTNPKRYTNPQSQGNHLHLHYKKCDLIDYILALKHTKSPNIHHFTHQLTQFFTLKTSFDEYTQNYEKQLQKKDQRIKILEKENHTLRRTCTGIEEYIGAIDK